MREMALYKLLFCLFLFGAVWQDIKSHSVEGRLYLAAGIGGLLTAFLRERPFLSVCGSAGIGVLLLLAGQLLNGEIGDGDGWFFVVTGLFLSLQENFLLLLSGLFFCGIYSLVLSAAAFGSGTNIRKLRIPFLPFLLPIGLWMALL